MISKTLSFNEENSISIALDSLFQNGVIVGTSDTIIGLLSNVTKEGFLKLNTIKKRYEKPYLLLVKNKQIALSLIENNSFQIEKLMGLWPAPLTLIFNAKNELPDYMKSSQGTIALRMPAHAGLLGLLEKLPILFSTSGNKAGQAVPKTVQEIDPDILNVIDYVILDEQSKDKETQPSTILDCTENSIKLVREGAFSINQIEKALGLVIQK